MAILSEVGPIVERLEGRRLLSASAAPHGAGHVIHVEAARKIKIPPPNVLGVYTGGLQLDTGFTDTLVVDITTQHARNFKGAISQGNGLMSKVTGTIDTAGNLHIKYAGTAKTPKFNGTGAGTLDPTGTTLDFRIMTHEFHQIFGGEIIASKT
ncbi:MAG TPA: hypothetical protein VG326_06365 [Tepidisphaeraceae bacterium]|jgi:hypothetical protein|nr:hypothetical protein [Tepidisphaeraceae bacterium]